MNSLLFGISKTTLILIVLTSFFSQLTDAQYEPRSNLDTVAQRPILPQCPREWEWACRNGECIAHYDVCDGIVQCTDGSDEWNCDSARNVNPLAHEGVAQKPKDTQIPAATSSPTATSTVIAKTGTVTIQYSHIIFAVLAFVLLSIAVVVVIRRRARKKSGFRNRRGHNMLQQDSDEDDILISSMYS